MLLPKRLAGHPDPAARAFFSLQADSPRMGWFRERGHETEGMALEDRKALMLQY